jgi:hypothetical protein
MAMTRLQVLGAKIFDCVCPTCGKAEGPFYIRHSVWFYCREHKVKWLAGYDLTADPDAPLDEDCKRRFEEIGLGDFKYLGPDAEEYEQAKRANDSAGMKP